MNAIQTLLTDHLDIWTAADTEKKSGRGRSSGNAASVYGIRKLRELILELAVRGKLVPQDANDEPASALLKRIQAEKARLIAEGKIRKDKSLQSITYEDKPFALPHGWNWIRLNELLKKIGAGSTPLGGKQVYVNDGVPFLRSQNVWDEGLRLNDVAFITPETHLKMSGTHVCAGDLLFNITGASIGRCAIVPDKFETGNVSQHVTIVRPLSKEILLFLHLVLISKHVQQTVMDVQVGVSREGLSIGKLGQFIIPIPPLAEQHRIVAKVDELMALCDQLETRHNNAAVAHEKLVSHLLGTLTQSQSAADFSANWQRIAAHFDTLFTTEASIVALKQTLLQLAVMGKLVLQDPNDEPASVLLKRIQAEKAKLIAEGKIKKDKLQSLIGDEEKQFELPHGWEWTKFPEVYFFQEGPGIRNWQFRSEGIKLLNVQNIVNGELMLANSDRHIDPDEYKKKYLHFTIEEKDLLFASSGGSWGKTTFFNDPGFRVIVNTSTVRMHPHFDFCSRFYMRIFVDSLQFKNQMVAQLVGMQPNFGSTHLSKIVLALPPLAEQHRIVAKVDELMALCDQLKSRITAAKQLQKKLAEVMVEQAVA